LIAVSVGGLGATIALYSPSAAVLDAYFTDGGRIQLCWIVACAILFTMFKSKEAKLFVLGVAMLPVLQKLLKMI
jgi:hypothetical protein